MTPKRISCFTETEIGKSINKDSSIEGFSIEGMRVDIKNGEIYVECNGNLYEISVAEFNRRPTDVMGRIINIRN